MERTPAAGRTPGLADLGFGGLRPPLATVLAAALPALGTLAAGATFAIAGVAAACGAAAALGIATWLRRRFGSELHAPLNDMARALDHLRSMGHAPAMREHGAPMLQPILRRVQLACIAIEERNSRSQANLMTIEAAFDRVHAVLQSLREGVLVVDRRGSVVMTNRSARSLLECDTSPEGRPLVDVVDGELREALLQDTERLARNDANEVLRADLPFRGRIFDLTLSQVQSNRPDQDFGTVVVLADVTRNHELNALKDELLSSISHELRTPLTNMCSSSEILTTLSAEDEHVWREFAHMLNSESRRLKMLVDDVMEYSQLETRRTQWSPQRADLCELARTAVALVQPLAAPKGLEIDCRTAAAAVEVLVDGQKLVEAMCRLLDNAVKFTPRGGQITMTVARHGDLAEVTVADSGVGISPADRERVFERFAQVGNVMTEKPPGTGLGLSITRRIVDAQGGTIWCEDSPLGGAQFRFVIPTAS